MGSVGCDKGIVCSKVGIFKLSQFAVSLCVVIAIGSTGFGKYQGTGVLAFVEFCGSFACITLIISAVIYFFKLYNLPLVKKLPWKMLEIGYALLCSVLFFIAMCICAANTTNFQWKSAITAGAVFSGFAVPLFLLFAFFIFRGMELPSEEENTGSNVNA